MKIYVLTLDRRAAKNFEQAARRYSRQEFNVGFS